MDEKQATREYYKVGIPAIGIYLLSMIGVDYINQHMDITNMILYSLSIIPIAATLTWMWAHWAFINELDECFRMIHYRAIMFGTAMVLAIGGGWGILETLVEAPSLPILQVLPIFWLSYGASAVYISNKLNKMPYEK